MSNFRQKLYPEINVAGYSRADSTVDFYTRINALLRPEMHILDFGAGRGQFLDDRASFKSRMQNFRGKVASVTGLDVDDAVLENGSLDRAIVVTPKQSWPVDDASIDLIVSDWTFEHIEFPQIIATECARVLKDGGWLCARTPNRHGYIAQASRLFSGNARSAALQFAQPQREMRDIFPTHYQINTPRDLAGTFSEFDTYHYPAYGEPAYFGRSPAAWRSAQLLHRLLPPALAPVILAFLQRRPRSGAPQSN